MTPTAEGGAGRPDYTVHLGLDGVSTPTQSGSDATMSNGHSSNGFHAHSSKQTPPLPQQEPIALVGMSCRLPGGCNTPQALWDFLMQGKIADNRPPASRFNLDGHYDGSGRPGTMPTPGGMFLHDVDLARFDASFFNISHAEAMSMDPQQRLLLETVYECTENCGLPLEALRGAKIGCLVGANSAEYEASFTRDQEDVIPGTSTGLSRSILSNRINHFLDVTGPSITLDTACSSTLVAVDMACSYLESHQADGMFVCGTMLYQDPGSILDVGPMGGAFSTSGRCHTFDAKADGYVRAEGINVVFLKRLSDAIRDGDPIRSVVRGTATNSDGHTPGITYPNWKAHSKAIQAAYQRAGISDLNETGYLECHGTGTLAGDPLEVAGASAVFAPTRPAENPLIIGSIKSNIGHSEPAAGLSGMIKAALALESGIIPGNPTFTSPNPRIDFEKSRVRATRTRIRWPKSYRTRRASVNSFGFGGSNAHAVLEAIDTFSAPGIERYTKSTVSSWVSNHPSGVGLVNLDDDEEDTETHRPYLLLFSANDRTTIKKIVDAISAHLINPRVRCDLRDVAYTLSERRTQHFHRAFLTTRSVDSIITSSESSATKRSLPPRIGFIFTGQGAQWSQMGKGLLSTFPLAMQTVKQLDAELQQLNPPPSWSLVAALTEKLDGQVLRLPELSQPLVTALQIAYLAVLRDWGIESQRVVGHSSGEIAAAVAAGQLAPSEAIRIAYFRGLAAKLTPPSGKLGMLAVGVSAEDVAPYLSTEPLVHIACFNSTGSLTLSGPQDALERVQQRLQKDSRFARLLQVNLAYHSTHMEPIAETYGRLLHEQCKIQQDEIARTDVAMFSSVSGQALQFAKMLPLRSHGYWIRNMLQPVRFSNALAEMVSGSQGSEFLIEIGPSNALAGPVSQVLAGIHSGGNAKAQYVSTAKRGPESLEAFLGVAGALWASGGRVNMTKVNGYDDAPTKPSFVVDLPNYRWNHSTRYWHESLANRDWRFRQFTTHDLLGSKIMGTSWQSPSWTRSLKLDSLPWLREHEVSGQVIFPGTGYISLAVEAIYQQSVMTNEISKNSDTTYSYHLRDVKFMRGLALTDDPLASTKIMVSMNPVTNSLGQWYEFRITARTPDFDNWTPHCTGLVRIQQHSGSERVPPGGHLQPPTSEDLKLPDDGFPGSILYGDLEAIGYHYGPSFQRIVEYEWVWGRRSARALLSMDPATSSYKQSSYPVHPVCLDSFLQICGFPIRQAQCGAQKDTIMIPAGIESLVIAGSRAARGNCLVKTEAYHVGVGAELDSRYNKVEGAIYDPEDGSTVLEASGVSFETLEAAGADRHQRQTYGRYTWGVDTTISDSLGLTRMLQKHDTAQDALQELLDLVIHRQPAVDVLEVNGDAGDRSCFWLHGVNADNADSAPRLAQSTYQYVSPDAESVRLMEDQYAGIKSVDFHLGNLAGGDLGVPGDSADLVIFKLKQSAANGDGLSGARKVMISLRRVLRKKGQLIFMGSNSSASGGGWTTDLTTDLKQAGFVNIKSVSCRDTAILLAEAVSEKALNESKMACLRFTETEPQELDPLLRSLGMRSETQIANIEPGSSVVILDELWESVTSNFTAPQWEMLQDLVRKECKILWVTSGAEMDVTHPHRATTRGVLHVIRNEEAHMRIISLDVEHPGGSNTVSAIQACAELLSIPKDAFRGDCEFVERGGLIHTSRLVKDDKFDEVKMESTQGRPLQAVDLLSRHSTESAPPFHLRTKRRGIIDSLHYVEADSDFPPPAEGWVEVNVHAAGLNFKDVAVVMAWAAGDQNKLGQEGAGIVSRVGPGVPADIKPGARVVFMIEGALASKVMTPFHSVHVIPDSMPFEVAASLPVAYLTSLYALFDLGGLKRGQRVLIHSAAGGVGNAAMQICKYMGAEIFATAGNEEKLAFLQKQFGIPDDHIFSSRTTEFRKSILVATDEYGVDIVLNSLTGELLEASWELVARGGTLVEIGKRDINDKNRLPMGPFNRGASFRALDLSHFRNRGETVQRLMKQLFNLLDQGHLQPVFPIQGFAFDKTKDAFTRLSSGKVMGKLVISAGSKNQENTAHLVQVRPAPRKVVYRDDVCYLIVGGLKGLGGSIAFDLARRGVKRLATLSRSGYDDYKSRIKIRQIREFGSEIDTLVGDVSNLEDVRRAFGETTVPVGGIIQAAMLAVDRPFSIMTVEEYLAALACKVQGTWNLHTVSLEQNLELDFFTLLSSISSVVGSQAQANYVAGNAFQDTFASYRHKLGLLAHTVNLGVVEDVGFMVNHDDVFQSLKNKDEGILTFMDSEAVCQMVQYSILQQTNNPVNVASRAQMVTGLEMPQPAHSELKSNPRFSHLFSRHSTASTTTGSLKKNGPRKADDSQHEVRALKLLLDAPGSEPDAVFAAAVKAISAWFFKSLRLHEPMETERPLTAYGIDSLVAVEFRNWVRSELGAVLSTLDVTTAASLNSLCEVIVAKAKVGK
ncbi:hypothetical protein B0T16DRAFT_338800 [Cercophora newfieldiana]|uniref:Polyketide synthase n=1 Tax=Cercophora newfieldiana TaxID=92897 RepID=A0AA40CJL0_9PEZI|nr:hypothetical protein B0T16DRAFT_338800 [Cercophora newfieldiana]